ncbi:MAG: hypothetical protein LBU23_09750 [Planctomycetota bacterium]|jgi:predicted dehydrogenase|nr:hypothetical protein [Planctomycetota bacterium]
MNRKDKMARYLVGEIEAVSGRLRTYTPEREGASGRRKIASEEDAVAVMDFANGALGAIRAAAVAAGRKNRLSWEISCSLGSLAFDLEDLNHLWVFHRETPVKEVTGFTKVNVTQLDRDHPFMDVWWPRGHGLGWEHAHINEVAHPLARVTAGRQVSPEGATFEDGYRAVRVIEAIRRSDRAGTRIRVDEVE